MSYYDSMSSVSQPTVASDSPPKHNMNPAVDPDSSKSYALSGKIMLISIVALFVVVVFLVILHLYARWYLRHHHRRIEIRRRNRRNRATRVVFYVDNNRGPNVPSGGLDASLLKSLPLFVYSSETNGKMPECAVCLSEFEEGENGRILPKCKHSFHTECIDMWFHSNSTCPLCRSPVEAVQPEMSILVEQPPESAAEPGSSGTLSSPVLHKRERTETSSLADRRKGIDVRIDVPRCNDTENDFRLPSPGQGFRSPGSRFLSLKKIISMSIKSPSSSVGPSCSPAAATESDVESARQESSRMGMDGS